MQLCLSTAVGKSLLQALAPVWLALPPPAIRSPKSDLPQDNCPELSLEVKPGKNGPAHISSLATPTNISHTVCGTALGNEFGKDDASKCQSNDQACQDSDGDGLGSRDMPGEQNKLLYGRDSGAQAAKVLCIETVQLARNACQKLPAGQQTLELQVVSSGQVKL